MKKSGRIKRLGKNVMIFLSKMNTISIVYEKNNTSMSPFPPCLLLSVEILLATFLTR